jgi:hypothetical protein
MALDIDSLIEQARDTHPAFDDTMNPDGMLLRYATRLERELVSECYKRRKGVISTVDSIALPLANFSAGEVFPVAGNEPALFVRGGTVLKDGIAQSVAFVTEWEHRERPPVFPSFYLLMGVLYLTAREQDWLGWDELQVVYVPQPQPLGPGSVLSLPDSVESVVVRELAAFLAERTPAVEGLPAIDRKFFRAMAAEARAAWYDQLARMESITTFAMDEY